MLPTASFSFVYYQLTACFRPLPAPLEPLLFPPETPSVEPVFRCWGWKRRIPLVLPLLAGARS